MIFYDFEKECWVDDKDSSFSVPMPTEESEGADSLSFRSQRDFFEWYQSSAMDRGDIVP